jgi:hypothetical protein
VTFRSNELITDDPVLGTEFTISVSAEIESSHTVTVRQLLKWAESSVEGGPALIVKRKKIRLILGLADDFSFEGLPAESHAPEGLSPVLRQPETRIVWERHQPQSRLRK